MKILLVGEYSRLHNSLKEGLEALGHSVDLISGGDGFKNYPTTFSYRPKYQNSFIGKLLFSVTKISPEALERGWKMKKLLPKLKGYDLVQLINEAPIQTFSKWEKQIHESLAKNNSKLFLLSSGTDSFTVNFWMKQELEYSPLTPYFKYDEAKSEFDYMLGYQSESHQKVSESLQEKVNGIIATDLDYVQPLSQNPKFLGLIPNPVNTDKIPFEESKIPEKVVIFLGINRHNQWAKGIGLFESALEKVKTKYADSVEIIIAENLPYSDYMKSYDRCHILLDQVYSQDQGYNALEAMARGKVVFTGAGKLFEKTYPKWENAAIDAEPNADKLFEKLSFLIENPSEINRISRIAHDFVEEIHDYKKVAQQYLDCWNKH